MITFIDLTFSARGQPASVVIDRLQRIPGISSVMGEHDLLFRWRSAEEFASKILEIHRALDGTEATYRIQTVEDSYQSKDPVAWFPAIGPEPSSHPAYPAKR